MLDQRFEQLCVLKKYQVLSVPGTDTGIILLSTGSTPFCYDGRLRTERIKQSSGKKQEARCRCITRAPDVWLKNGFHTFIVSSKQVGNKKIVAPTTNFLHLGGTQDQNGKRDCQIVDK